jgi:hypothetical protein
VIPQKNKQNKTATAVYVNTHRPVSTGTFSGVSSIDTSTLISFLLYILPIYKAQQQQPSSFQG